MIGRLKLYQVYAYNSIFFSFLLEILLIDKKFDIFNTKVSKNSLIRFL